MDVHEAINVRRSVRSYDSRPIPPEIIEKLRVALRSAPSACNFQPWHFVFVTDTSLRRQVAEASHGQLWMAAAPLTVVACGMPQQAFQRMSGRSRSSDIDVAIAVDHLTLAAVAEGLGTCWIGAFDADAVAKLIALPNDWQVVALTPVGYPSSPDLNHPLAKTARKPPREIFSENRYGNPTR